MRASVELSEESSDLRTQGRDGTRREKTLGYLLATWARQSYDELGKLALANGILFLAATLALAPSYLLVRWTDEETASFPMGLLLLTVGFTGAWVIVCVWFAVNAYLERLFTFQYPTWTEALHGFGRHGAASFWTLTFFGGAVGVLAFNLWVYPVMLANHAFIRTLAIGLTLWIALFLALVQVHLIPLLVHQDRPFFTALRRAAKVAVWKPFWTLTILLIQMLFAALYLIPPFFLIVPSLYAALSNLSLLILLEDWKDPYEKTPEAIRAGA